MNVRSAICVALLAFAVPLLWVGSIVWPYLGSTDQNRCSVQEIVLVEDILSQHHLKREYAQHLVRNDFPYSGTGSYLPFNLKNGLRQAFLEKVRTNTYVAASFCSGAVAHDGHTLTRSIPKIAARLTGDEEQYEKYTLAACVSLEAVNLRHTAQDIRTICKRHSASWAKRQDR